LVIFGAIFKDSFFFFILVEVFEKAVSFIFVMESVGLVEAAEVERFAEILGEILANSFLSGAAAFYSSSGSEFADIGSAVSTGFKVFVESALVSVRDNGSGEKMKVPMSVFL
jgi:hypothetical protein